jgi:hypothetical protein
MAIRPLWVRDGNKSIGAGTRQEYFGKGGWTVESKKQLVGKSVAGTK